jgi:hypothetical protein
MRGRTCWILLFVLSFAIAAQAAPGRYVEVEIEVFRSWGFLGWGTWEPLSSQLISTQIAPLAAADRDALAVLSEACGVNTLDEHEAACAQIMSALYGTHRSYAVVPLLGSAYRLVLTNLTDADLGIVLSVDGLNSNGNAPVVGTAADLKWILLPHQTVRISGWQVTADEALQFEFATPSQTHSYQTAERGTIVVYAYLPNPLASDQEKGTGAGNVIDQPTVRIPFESATTNPVETFRFDYSRDRVALGILCENTDGAGIRVIGVVEGTSAEQRGLLPGDIITYANAVPVNSCRDLQAVLETKSPGDRIVLKVHREDRVFLLTVELEE